MQGPPRTKDQLHHHPGSQFRRSRKTFEISRSQTVRSSNKPSEQLSAMALPVVKSAIDCTDLSATVSPYLYQLKTLPQLVFESISNLAALRQVYLDTNPLITALAFSLFLVPIFLIVSEVNKNYSQVDRCWSILPTFYVGHYVTYAHLMGLETKRLDTLLAASIVWSVSRS